MKVCIPIDVNKGLESKPFSHFGSAPMFVICDLDNGDILSINNGDLNHEHGKCQPLKALSGHKIDAVIAGGIGQGAIAKLNSMKIKVFKSQADTIKENINLFKEDKLDEFSLNHTCSHDGCSHN